MECDGVWRVWMRNQELVGGTGDGEGSWWSFQWYRVICR